MAAASLLTLLDDIATILDDVALMTKTAAQKTAGVLGDDLALNAQQVSGVNADRELAVVWAVAKGSFKNKLILVPAAIAISAFAPWAVTPLLILGGLFLCFEGVEKLAHRWLHSASEREAKHQAHAAALANPAANMADLERDKIAGAIRTDFILSAEIIVIALGTVASASMPMRIVVLAAIGLLMTVGVYGLVAGIVKLDDLGLLLSRARGDGVWASLQRSVGRALVLGAPWLMKGLSVAGTAAMFLVGGGILVHGMPALHHAVTHVLQVLQAQPGLASVFGIAGEPLLNAMAGVLAGAMTLVGVTLIGWVVRTDR